jgi:hypothetical protein
MGAFAEADNTISKKSNETAHMTSRLGGNLVIAIGIEHCGLVVCLTKGMNLQVSA